MRLKYTGRADVLSVDGKTYHTGDIVPISKERAAAMAAQSRLHSFETVDGADVLDEVTAPAPKAEPKTP